MATALALYPRQKIKGDRMAHNCGRVIKISMLYISTRFWGGVMLRCPSIIE